MALPESKRPAEELASAPKRPKNAISTIAECFVCPITHMLMNDPVTASDGNTYERSAITQWIKQQKTSPVDPSVHLNVTQLFPARAVLHAIEEFVKSADLDDELSGPWKAAKKEMDLEKAQKLYSEGNVLDAAKLGLLKAQAKTAQMYYTGTGGVYKDATQFMKWATVCAEQGDRIGQELMGIAHFEGFGPAKNYAGAVKWFELSMRANLLTSHGMYYMGMIYKIGGFGIVCDVVKALEFFKKGADVRAQYTLAQHYYYGGDVPKPSRTSCLMPKATPGQEPRPYIDNIHF